MIAEDLGVITPAVERLRDGFALPGMKILQFAFDGNDDNPYLPDNFQGSHWLVYTGTHDNATCIGWWQGLPEEQPARATGAGACGVGSIRSGGRCRGWGNWRGVTGVDGRQAVAAGLLVERG